MARAKSGASLRETRRPIGVFDSGLGGLTIVRQIRRSLPHEDIIYFGDLARLPYGTKSKEQIIQFSIQNTFFLLKQRIKTLVIACNSSASAAYPFISRNFNLPVVEVIEPAVKAAYQASKTKRIGLVATSATIESRAYEKAFLKLDDQIQLFTSPCPLFVPLVEEGWFLGEIPEKIAGNYLAPIISRKIDSLILGCTHYPLLTETIKKVLGNKIHLIDSVIPTVQKLEKILDANQLRSPAQRDGKLKVFVSDKPRNFVRVGEQFLGERISQVDVVRHK